MGRRADPRGTTGRTEGDEPHPPQRPPPNPVLALQAAAGNAGTALLLRRGGTGLATPESPVHPPQELGPPTVVADHVTAPAETGTVAALPPDVAKKLIAAQTTLGRMQPIHEKDRATLATALPGAQIADLLLRREELREGIELTQAQLTSMMPAGGQPDDSVAYQIHSLGQFLESKRVELEGIQPQIDELVRRTGAASEAELAKVVTEDFPALFIQRAREIASQQLWDNEAILNAEAARYGVTLNPQTAMEAEAEGRGPQYLTGAPNAADAEGLRAAARELCELKRAREAAEANVRHFSHMEDEYEAGLTNPDPTGQMAANRAGEVEREAFERHVLEFPILHRVDVETVVKATDEELVGHVHTKVLELYGNIAATRANLWDGKLKVWNLRDVVDLTLIDLSIPEDSPLVGVVERHIREAETESGILEMALTALQITAALVAIFATGGTALAAGLVGAGVSIVQLSGAVDDYMMESAASNVALDPEVADISVNEPRLMPIVFGVLSLGLDAIGVGQALKALRLPARALMSGGDLASFSAAAYRTLPRDAAEKLVARASALPEIAAAKGAVGTTARGTAWTHDQILDLFTRHFQRSGPPRGSIVFHDTEATYEAVRQAAGMPPNTAGFFAPADEALAAVDEVAAMGSIHLPPTATTLTVMHESLHMIGRQSGVDTLLGRYVEEGLTEWMAREAFGPEAGRFIYDDNVAFVRTLAREVGDDVLKGAYLHGSWGPLRTALAARLGGKQANVQHFYELLRRVGPNGERGTNLGDALDMLFPKSASP
jgi:hypothetical protein